ncbi:MAG: GNAT family N-acetyltransferase [Bacteroidales bacterium]|nr:GNAT family N-acetyltransferase [Bacteroidales bacterium]
MKLTEVKDKKTIWEFLEVPKILYKNDPNWICPLDLEIENTFNPQKNACFSHGDARRWVLKSEQGKLIGRIAAFYDDHKAHHNPQPTGGMGFFECIDDQQAANLLFDTAKEWLTGKGMKAMDGPVNFGENFVNWGLLVEGFMPQGYGMPYNFPYYRSLFENYGFKTYFEQYSFHDNFSRPYPEQMRKFGERFWRKPEYSFKHLEMKEAEKYIRELVVMYNKIWVEFLENYTPLKFEDFYGIFTEAKAMLDENYIWFGYHKGQPIGFLIVFPDMNQVFRKLKNGRLNLINIIRLLYYKKRAITRGRLLLSGVIPEFQRTGVVGGMYIKLTDAMRENGMEELELSWVGDYNLTVNRMYNQFGATKEKTHITYRYLFDREAPFERFNNLSKKFEKDRKKEQGNFED